MGLVERDVTMNKYEKDEMRHWRKECYRTLRDAEQGTDKYFSSSNWERDADYVGRESAAVAMLAFAALALGLYCLGI